MRALAQVLPVPRCSCGVTPSPLIMCPALWLWVMISPSSSFNIPSLVARLSWITSRSRDRIAMSSMLRRYPSCTKPVSRSPFSVRGGNCTVGRVSNSLRKTVEALRNAGISVYVVGQSPEFAMDVRLLAYRSGKQTTREVLAWTPAIAPHLNQEVGALASGATFVDPMALLCNAGLCAYRTAENFLYSDFGHLSEYGARLAVNRLFPFLLREGQEDSRSWPAPENRADIAD